VKEVYLSFSAIVLLAIMVGLALVGLNVVIGFISQVYVVALLLIAGCVVLAIILDASYLYFVERTKQWYRTLWHDILFLLKQTIYIPNIKKYLPKILKIAFIILAIVGSFRAYDYIKSAFTSAKQYETEIKQLKIELDRTEAEKEMWRERFTDLESDYIAIHNTVKSVLSEGYVGNP